MDGTVTTIIDRETCTGCGLCVKVCPSRTISMVEGKAAVTGDGSLGCGHCEAICPVDAVTVGAINPQYSQFASFESDNAWLPHGDYPTEQLVKLMQSRRSCRNYTEKPVPREILEDLVKIGITAPSGANRQLWTFTILPSRDAVSRLGEGIRRFFMRLNKVAERAVLRKAMKFLGKPALEIYHRDYYETVKEALNEFEETGFDRLTYGAPAAIVIASQPNDATPIEDALLATQNILLGAHSMGLGTCLIGLAVVPMKQERSIQSAIGIPMDETVYSVIVLGYPDEKYVRQAGRKEAVIRWAED